MPPVLRPPGAGELRHRVVIQEDAGTAQDGHGQRTQEWTTYATVWAKVNPLTGRELFYGRQVVPDVTHEVWLRYGRHTAKLSPVNRLVMPDGLRILEPVSCLRVSERGFWWLLSCVERARVTAAGGFLKIKAGGYLKVKSGGYVKVKS